MVPCISCLCVFVRCSSIQQADHHGQCKSCVESRKWIIWSVFDIRYAFTICHAYLKFITKLKWHVWMGGHFAVSRKSSKSVAIGRCGTIELGIMRNESATRHRERSCLDCHTDTGCFRQVLCIGERSVLYRWSDVCWVCILTCVSSSVSSHAVVIILM